MGKQSKLRKSKKQQDPTPPTPTPENDNRDRFIQNIEKQGYSFKKIQQAPQVPEKRTEPQL